MVFSRHWRLTMRLLIWQVTCTCYFLQRRLQQAQVILLPSGRFGLLGAGVGKLATRGTRYGHVRLWAAAFPDVGSSARKSILQAVRICCDL